MIVFRKTKETNGYLSNMCGGYPIKIFDKQFRTTEALYQSIKFNDQNIQQQILNAKSPMQAKMISRYYDVDVRSDWQNIQVDVMRFCNQLKFIQHLDIMQKLINTKSEQIVQYDRTPNSFWGRNTYTGDGKNMLGHVLMDLRETLTNNKSYDEVNSYFAFAIRMFGVDYWVHKSNNIYKKIKK